MSAPDVSVLLVSWNTRNETRACLDALPAAVSDGLSYEVVAVDNGSRDGSAELLATYPRVRLIRNGRNVGFAAAVNQAHRLASGRLVLLLNSDVRFHPGALSTMVRFLADRPDAAGVSPLYLNPDGSFQQHYVQLPSFPAAVALVTSWRRAPWFRGALHTFQLRGQDFSRPRPLASGSCMLLRREILEPDRIFDERFPIFWNDAILTRQLNEAGHLLWMTPDAVITHSRGASCRLLGPAIRFRHLLGSLVTYLRVTGSARRLPAFRTLVMADHLGKRLLGRPVEVGLRDLRAALRGDVGPLPDGDIRDWLVLFSRARWSGDPAGPTVPALVAGRRFLYVDPPAGWRLRVRQVGPAMWHVTPPAVLPLDRRWPAAHRINLRIAAGLLRTWLDRYAGARFVLLDDERDAPVVGMLGGDRLVVDRGPRAIPEVARG